MTRAANYPPDGSVLSPRQIESILVRMQKNSAFTLIELIVVIGIIAILAAMAIPAISQRAMKGIQEQVDESFNKARALQPAVTMYFATTNQCPDNTSEELPAFGIARNTAYSDLYANQIDTGGEPGATGGCTIDLVFKHNGVNALLKGRHLSMRLFGMDQHVVKWACFTDVEQKGWRMIPRVCRFASAAEAEVAQAPE